MIDIEYGCFEEQLRHWWSNECPHFVAEVCCRSLPVKWHDEDYDGTMRIVFALRKKNAKPKSTEPGQWNQDKTPADQIPAPEELEIEWLGGYWKLPKYPMDSPKLRDRIISAARTSGTAHVDSRILAEVYAAMGDSLQRLFGGNEPSIATISETYMQQPELAAYLSARLAVGLREIGLSRMTMKQSAKILAAAPDKDTPIYRCAESFVERGLGVVAAITPPGQWQKAQEHFQKSVELLPTNATSLYLCGQAELEIGDTGKAALLMLRAILLDLDFKAPYVNLGVAFLRLRKFSDAVDVSEACLNRHPESPQCNYTIGFACYQMLIDLEEKSGSAREEIDKLRRRALNELLTARDHEEAQRLLNRGRVEPPWLDEDDRMLAYLRGDAGARSRRSVDKVDVSKMESNEIGWKFYGWRT
eukprot:gnl/TRDRNA2_/TRDRNA2_139301_c2_seq1.p1 gnl/TRDRNA2_/TRDRNA2_139301_c2~~gnl/TRDRNA2_/TRDRNA2_139301_c2_seq1.p1  ORF type:complete len:416 (+),score=72.79 gnl/TRDRNA2_/TRDRNA2_139301_c2_seq1:3-1250(+)